MLLTLEYSVRLQDYWSWRPRRSFAVVWLRCIAAIVILAVGWESFVETQSYVGLFGHALLAVFVAVPIGYWVMLSILPLFRMFGMTTLRITVDDEGIETQQGTNKSRLPWSSFQVRGSVSENDYGFNFECGRGGQYIPHRAFAFEVDRAELRAFLTSKLGDRFHARL